MWCVVGLGNPGVRYRLTRHNAGFLVLERLQKLLGCTERKRTRLYDARTARLGDSRLLLVRPLTYMNRSGAAVKAVCERYDVSLRELIVVCDDVSLPVGKIRIRKKGSSGGHNGLQSMIETLGTQSFSRLRMGIGRPEPGESLEGYVLRKPERRERREFSRAVAAAADALLCSLGESLDAAMQKFN